MTAVLENTILPIDVRKVDAVAGFAEKVFVEVAVSKVLRKILRMGDKGILDCSALHFAAGYGRVHRTTRESPADEKHDLHPGSHRWSEGGASRVVRPVRCEHLAERTPRPRYQHEGGLHHRGGQSFEPTTHEIHHTQAWSYD